jgi:hypothetical protein
MEVGDHILSMMVDDDSDFWVSEFTENDMKAMYNVLDAYYTSDGLARKAKRKAKQALVQSLFGRTVTSAIAQAKRVDRAMAKAQREARTQANLQMQKSAKVLDIQLKFIGEDMYDRKRDELDDITARIESLESKLGSGEPLPTSVLKTELESIKNDINDVQEEDDQQKNLIVSMRDHIKETVTEAREKVAEGDKKAVEIVKEANEEQEDLVEIEQEMRNNGDIPSTFSDVPDAPPPPGHPDFTKPQNWRTQDGDVVKVTPQQAAVAEEVKDSLQESEKNLFDSLKEAVTSRHERMGYVEETKDDEPNGGDEWEDEYSGSSDARVNAKNDIIRIVLDMRARAGLPIDGSYGKKKKKTKTAKTSMPARATTISNRSAAKKPHPYYRTSLPKTVTKKEEDKSKSTTPTSSPEGRNLPSRYGRNTRPVPSDSAKAKVSPSYTRRNPATTAKRVPMRRKRRPVPTRRRVPMNRRDTRKTSGSSTTTTTKKPLPSSSSLMSTLDDAEETKNEDNVFEMPDAYTSTRVEEEEVRPLETRKSVWRMDSDSEEESEDYDDTIW